MINFVQKGDFSKLIDFLEKISKPNRIDEILERYGQLGVDALRSATPKDTGNTANQWSYKIDRSGGSSTIAFYNSNINKGVPVAIILQYGHGTGWGGYVEGKDYINPALQPIFEKIADEAWREVTKA